MFLLLEGLYFVVAFFDMDFYLKIHKNSSGMVIILFAYLYLLN
jgi:hypothetical protein